MEIQALSLSVGSVGALQADPVTPGWYRSVFTGQQYYYDGVQFWTVTAAGTLVAMGAWSPAPKQITIAPGETLKVTLGFQYKGPAVTGVQTRYVIGVYGAAGLTEKLYVAGTLNIPANAGATFVSVTDFKTFLIPTSIQADWDDIYVKMWGGTPIIDGEIFPKYEFGYENALKVTGVVIDITEFKIADFVKVTA